MNWEFQSDVWRFLKNDSDSSLGESVIVTRV